MLSFDMVVPRSLSMICACWAAAACGPRPLPAGYAGDDARAFVREHRTELQKEIAIGSGPRSNDLGVIAGCQNRPELDRRLHKEYDAIFTPEPVSDEEVAERVVSVLEQTPELRCLDLELSRQSEYTAGRRHIGPSRANSIR